MTRTEKVQMLLAGVIAGALAVIVVITVPRLSRQPGLHEAPAVPASPRLGLDQTGADWPTTGGGPMHTGQAPGRLAADMGLAWSFQTGGPVRSSPVIVSDLVYVGSADANLYALDLATGKLVWSYKASDAIEADITVVDNKVLFGCGDGWFYAVSTRGQLLWRYRTGAQITGAANWYRAGD
ncbi:MAG: PQQ-binding-like beta-propeller repeat protein, partial [Sedimentisphaerales bacterium]|nr:PQQ-binding-like beta-propeller repeat protein [Sedimentisphaerales bacterium]